CKTISKRANGVMHISREGISVRNVSRATIVHEEELEPGTPGMVMRISLEGVGVSAGVGFVEAALADATTDKPPNTKTSRSTRMKRKRVVMRPFPTVRGLRRTL